VRTTTLFPLSSAAAATANQLIVPVWLPLHLQLKKQLKLTGIDISSFSFIFHYRTKN
jgi:hypothetical protein